MIYICERCGKWAGATAALAVGLENAALALQNLPPKCKPGEVPCSDCKAPMRQVNESDRLRILPKSIEVELHYDGNGDLIVPDSIE